MEYSEIVERRRSFRLDGYTTLVEVGFDGPWVTPYQMTACSPGGPVLVGYNWFDAPSVERYRAVLKQYGYLPGIPFNTVLSMALSACGMERADLYMTQAFHLLPTTRSAQIPSRDVDASFDAVTRFELAGRRVIALGTGAAGVCRRHGIRHHAVPHPSARGTSFETKAGILADALRQACS